MKSIRIHMEKVPSLKGRICCPVPSGAELRWLRDRAHRAALILHDEYGSPRHGNKDDPVDELVFIILSQMTTHHSFNRVFDRLKASVPDWNSLIVMPVGGIRELIADAGLSHQKAPHIKRIAERLSADFGAVDLAPLRDMSDGEAEDYLVTLPGVGVKSARCVLMYSLGRTVLPADTHVWRMARRLGLLPERTGLSHVHDVLHLVVRPDDRYRFHVNAVCHGRSVCRARRPRCGKCSLLGICPTATRGGATPQE